MDPLKFKVGDRVRYVGLAYPAVTVGSVLVADGGPFPFPYRVLFDYWKGKEDESNWSIGAYGLLCSEDELELENVDAQV